jgi:hypothetical protein
LKALRATCNSNVCPFRCHFNLINFLGNGWKYIIWWLEVIK